MWGVNKCGAEGERGGQLSYYGLVHEPESSGFQCVILISDLSG